jgi:hypothetical protein
MDRVPGGLVIHAVVSISFLGAGAIVAITLLRPGHDNTALILSVLGFLAPTVAALLALAKSVQNGAVMERLEVKLDGRMTQLLEQVERAAKSEGREEGAAVAAAATTTVPVVVAAAPVVSTDETVSMF